LENVLEEFVKTRLMFGLVTLLVVASAVFAHGDKKHVVGTVEKINSSSVIVKTADGKPVEVRIVATTVFVERSGSEDKPAKLPDLAVGNRVVIHATANGNALEADEIRFSKPGTMAHGSSAPSGKRQP
jgi:Domain of unknown function (DUF5666)